MVEAVGHGHITGKNLFSPGFNRENFFSCNTALDSRP